MLHIQLRQRDLPIPEHLRHLQDPHPHANPGISHPTAIGRTKPLQALHPCPRLDNNRMALIQFQADRLSQVTFNIRNATGERRRCWYDPTLYFLPRLTLAFYRSVSITSVSQRNFKVA